jgi:hypothetical protein
MVTESQKEIIAKIQTLQMALEKRMDERLPEIFAGLADQVIELTNELPFDPKDRAKRIREIIGLKSKIVGVIAANPEYIKEVAELTNGFKEIKKLSDLYFSELIDGFNAKEELYRAILDANITLTRDQLLGPELSANFKNAVTKVLQANAAGISSRTELQKTLRQFIEGTPTEKAYLNRYVSQVTNDSVMTFSREYVQTISSDLNLQFYFYQGTAIQDTRPFCLARHGRYYKKSEVENWANLGDWQGRRDGTTKTTIFSFCGGYNCRHTLFPVSKTQYTLAQKRGQAGMK